MALKAPGRPSSRWSKSCQRPRSSSSADLVRFCFWEGGGRERVGKEKREKGEGRDETEKKRKTKCACAPCARGPSPGISVLIAPRRRFRQCRDRRGMLGRALVCFWPSGPALVCFGKLPKIESPRFPEKKSATKRERGKTAGLLSLTSEPRRRRAPSRSRSTRARSPSQAADRTTPASRQRGSPGTSRAQWSFVGRGAALTPPTSTHQRRASAAAARCSAIFGEQFSQERSLSRLFALCWGFGIEGRGGWPSGRSRRACRSRLLRDERRKMGGSDSVEVALFVTFERKRERERRERERGGRRNSLPLFPSSTPIKSPLSPAMGIKVRLVPLLWSDDRLECVFASRRKSESEKKRKAHHHRSLFVVDDVGIEKTFQISSTSSGPLQAPRRRGPDLPPREQVRKLLWQADRGRRVDAHLPVLGKWICLTGIKKVIVFELVRSFSLFLSLFLSLNKPGRRRPHGRPAADRPVRGGHEVRGAGWRRR